MGALKNWTALQDDYNCIYCIVDLHSITVRQEPSALKKQIRNALIEYIACGLDPEKNIIFVQSHVSAHAELQWILNCYTYVGELGRMTQFKEKSRSHADNINAGLFTYPVLMAADILLYNTSLVPVGIDQTQHIEIARDIAIRFNSIYGDVFTVPEGYFGKEGSKIMSLQEPAKKMSKSDDNLNNVVFLNDEPKLIMKKIKRAMTDSGSEIVYGEDKPGVSNLLSIYCAAASKTIKEAEKEFEGVGYGRFKETVGEAVISAIEPIQKKVAELSESPDYIDGIMRRNAERAGQIAEETLKKVYEKIGLITI